MIQDTDKDEDRSLSMQCEQFDRASHGGELITSARVGREVFWDDPFVQLLRKVQAMRAQSTHPDAAVFDVEVWLYEWVKKPQPALGGRCPKDVLHTPAGLEASLRLLGAILSGSIQ